MHADDGSGNPEGKSAMTCAARRRGRKGREEREERGEMNRG
jgi:hypothetical protein